MKTIKLAGLVLAVSVLNIAVFSPGLLGLTFGDGAFAAALGASLLLGSALAVFYGSYMLLAPSSPRKPGPLQPAKHEDYAAALRRYRAVKPLRNDIKLAIMQLERLEKRKAALHDALSRRFDPSGISFRKFAASIREVEKLFYWNVGSLLSRLNAFDGTELEQGVPAKAPHLSPELLKERADMYNGFLAFVAGSLSMNEEILLRLDKLQVELSRLDSLMPEDVEAMPCMQDIDVLIKQTKFYRR